MDSIVLIERALMLFALGLLLLADGWLLWTLFESCDLRIKDLHDVRDLFLLRLNLFACSSAAQ